MPSIFKDHSGSGPVNGPSRSGLVVIAVVATRVPLRDARSGNRTNGTSDDGSGAISDGSSDGGSRGSSDDRTFFSRGAGNEEGRGKSEGSEESEFTGSIHNLLLLLGC